MRTVKPRRKLPSARSPVDLHVNSFEAKMLALQKTEDGFNIARQILGIMRSSSRIRMGFDSWRSNYQGLIERANKQLKEPLTVREMASAYSLFKARYSK